ncbi:hypothetical protein G647_09676 [Cladophialophora carrionii CBS 160.54]|uniref:Uncharacterized protein n=1 Tax=Cladophialophora carrionii CBS 160.54 TaxID=1279043 RepID=V9DKV4_9EURO|nr:uncharacterized protein G647_09676 [Cladophialophora carrionii CBS 160.54]ETI27485.1 hypothetical protein G647_09676 [Cladophialophora carrionii CBS 160.54]
MSGLDMRAYYSEEDPYLSRSYSQNGKHAASGTFGAKEAGWGRCGAEVPTPAQPDNETQDTKVDGWEILGQNAQKSVHLDVLGIYDHTNADDKAVSPGSKSKPNDMVKCKTHPATRRLDTNKAWEIVPHEPDWDMVNRKETREARRATKPDAPLAKDWVMYKERMDAEADTFGAYDPAPSTPQGEPDMHEPTEFQTKQGVAAPPIFETMEPVSRLPCERLHDSQEQGPQAQTQAQPRAIQTTPAKAQRMPQKDHHSCLSLGGRPTGHASKHNPFKQRPFSAEEKDLPFLPPPSPSQAGTTQSSASARLDYPEIIRKLRAASITPRGSPEQNAVAAVRETARRTDERLARTERVPFDWYGMTHRANPRRYR